MDDAHLKKILQQENENAAPENAKKRALNLAMAEFDQHQKEKENNFQGSGFFSRLTGVTNKNNRRKDMKKKTYIFGGTATAMALVLAVGLSMHQAPHTSNGSDVRGHVGGNNFGSIAQNITTSTSKTPFSELLKNLKSDSSEQVQPEMRREIEEYNISQVDQITKSDDSARPAPITPSRSNVAAKEEAKKMASPSGNRMQAQGYAAETDMAVASSPPVMQMIAPIDMPAPHEYKDVGRDKFEDFTENPITLVSEAPVSTFSIDVDTSSYSFMRRQLESGVLPQKDAVRIEEMVNYFDYDYALPENREQPFAATATITPSPWAEGRKLMHIGIKGFDIDQAEKPRSNLVFLLDVSGSMNATDKLPLLKNSMKMLLDSLEPEDTVAIAVYAGASGTVLEPTKVSEKSKIIAALENLSAGGSTAGAAGLKLAYELAEQNFDKDAVNRVILATDGDFNVGITSQDELQDFIERKRDSGVFLSVLGFGQGNLNDQMMQKLAQNGNGTAAYIDSLNEARKVLVEEASSTLFPIAKDVKIQIEFNPKTVAEYRLIGYETRHLNREDFNNDAVDAGDIGTGHTVTAIYEITPVDSNRSVDESRYASKDTSEAAIEDKTDFNNEYAFLKIRYKLPKEDVSKLITTPVTAANEVSSLTQIVCIRAEGCPSSANNDVRFSAAVAGFGQLLKGGKYIGDVNYDEIITLAQESKGVDEFGYRAEFIQLVRLAKSAATMGNPQ